MLPKDTLAEYRRTQIMGMSQAQLVVMLYQGATRYLYEAIELVRAERYDRSWQKFDRARRIVTHLYGTLNPAAGDLSNKLGSLYAYLIDQITVANARHDIEVAENCIQILTTLKDGWEQLAVQTRTGSTAGERPLTETAGVAGVQTCCFQA